MKTLRLGKISYELFPSGYWRASVMLNNHLVQAIGDTKTMALSALKDKAQKH